MRTVTTITLIVSTFLLKAQSDVPARWGDKVKMLDPRYIVSNFVAPKFFEADLSGDGKKDLAISVEAKKTRKKGIAIFLAGSDIVFVLGAGTSFGNGGDDFSWADKWSISRQRTIYETTFKTNGDVDEGRELTLERPAIRIAEDEGSGGLIYYDGKKFTWIQQGD